MAVLNSTVDKPFSRSSEKKGTLKELAENSSHGPVITYYPAKIYEGKEWYVGFYALDPASGKLKRVKRKINRIESISERRRFGRLLVRKINDMLADGWNPFIEQEAGKSHHLLSAALSRFMDVKRADIRSNSFRRYEMYMRVLRTWIYSNFGHEVLVIGFTPQHSAQFLEYIWQERSRNPRTYNNYLRFCKVLWNWMVEFQYCRHNPFAPFRAKRTTEKERTVIPSNIRREIREDLSVNSPGFLFVCELVFSALLRPTEITKIQLRDINLDSQTITISASTSKVGKSRITTIPNVLLDELASRVDRGQPTWHLISKDLDPGKDPCSYRILQRHWNSLRERLDLKKELKFYSLRDTGIVQQLQDGISPEEVMKQAGHSSLDTTSIYVKHVNPNGSFQVKTKSTGF